MRRFLTQPIVYPLWAPLLLAVLLIVDDIGDHNWIGIAVFVAAFVITVAYKRAKAHRAGSDSPLTL